MGRPEVTLRVPNEVKDYRLLRDTPVRRAPGQQPGDADELQAGIFIKLLGYDRTKRWANVSWGERSGWVPAEMLESVD